MKPLIVPVVALLGLGYYTMGPIGIVVMPIATLIGSVVGYGLGVLLGRAVYR